MLNKILLFAFSSFLLFTSPQYAQCGEMSEVKQYEEFVQAIKDNPQQAIADLRTIADTNNSAAIEYLILLSIYEPDKINTTEFEQIAEKLHTLIIAQYEKIVEESPFYGMYQRTYLDLVKDNHMRCYKDLKCLIEVGAFTFSKFFDIWDNWSGNASYVPWKIIVPCPVAQKLHLTAIFDGAGGGHGAETLDISNCYQYSEYDFPDDVKEYRDFIWKKLPLTNEGSIRFVYYAMEIYESIRHQFDPDWNFDEMRERHFSIALPLEQWAMESYPNYRDFAEIINHGIGFNSAVDKLTEHYIKTFGVNKDVAQKYAYYTLTPWTAQGNPVDKETLRYKILSSVPMQDIKAWIEEKKIKGEEFEEPETPHLKDEILMISIHRPDVLKMLIESCPNNDEKLGCSGLNTDINAVNEFGKTALMYAAQYGFMESVKILLDEGADVNAQTNDASLTENYCWDDICIANGKRTALMYAVQEGNLDIARYLVEHGADINLTDSKGMSVYDYLNGKAPYFGNYKRRITEFRSYYDDSASDTHENKNVLSEQGAEFTDFLDKHKRAQ